MGSTSTHLISYHKIKVNDIDLLDDAWGLSSEFSDVMELLRQVKPAPGRRLTKKLMDKIRKHD